MPLDHRLAPYRVTRLPRPARTGVAWLAVEPAAVLARLAGYGITHVPRAIIDLRGGRPAGPVTPVTPAS